MLRKLFLLTMFMAVAGSFTGFSQATNTASANADAVLSQPVAVNLDQHLVFGGFMPSSDPGTVVMPANPYNNRSATDGVTLVNDGYTSHGKISVSGDPGAIYHFTLPSEPVQISLLGQPSTYMTLTGIGYYTSSGLLQLDEDGLQDVYFGGVLNVSADQTLGSYEGSFEITATYQ